MEKAKSSPISSPHELHGAGTLSSPCSYFIILGSTASQILTCVGITMSPLLQAHIQHADLLRLVSWHGGFDTSAGLGASTRQLTVPPLLQANIQHADLLQLVSWPCRLFFKTTSKKPKIQRRTWNLHILKSTTSFLEKWMIHFDQNKAELFLQVVHVQVSGPLSG